MYINLIPKQIVNIEMVRGKTFFIKGPKVPLFTFGIGFFTHVATHLWFFELFLFAVAFFCFFLGFYVLFFGFMCFLWRFVKQTGDRKTIKYKQLDADQWLLSDMDI